MREILDYTGFNNYIKKQTKKNKIVIHGTAGGTAQGSINWMKSGSGRGVATTFIITQNADIIRLFPQKFFGYHAGGNFRQLSKHSFGIQIVNWVNLDIKLNQYITWTGKKIPKQQVILLPSSWRGYKAFHAITPQQHLALQSLLKYLCQTYNIRKKMHRVFTPNINYNDPNVDGIFLHSTFHPTKLDFPPTIVPTINI